MCRACRHPNSTRTLTSKSKAKDTRPLKEQLSERIVASGFDAMRVTTPDAAPEAVAAVVNPLLALMQQHRTDYSLF